MVALLFPGQGAQFPGMAKSLYEEFDIVKERFVQAKDILGFDIQEIMFEGTEEELKQTSVTQPAIFIHSVTAAEAYQLIDSADMVAGHSLGEFSALVIAGVLSFEDALNLVSIRADAMQHACDLTDSTMAAILGLEDKIVEEICDQVEDEIVVPANYNTIGQVVISGSKSGIVKAMELAQVAGAKRVVPLAVNGAFHSPLMEPARVELAQGIEHMPFNDGHIPIYQNVSGRAHVQKEEIKDNLLAQLTAPVRWTQTVQQMLTDGADQFTEVGPGKVLSGLVKKIDRKLPTRQLS